MQIRRLTAATAAGLALVALAGCRTNPNVAAYVGSDRVTVAELESAVEDRLEDPALEAAGTDRPEYTRQVLTRLIEDEVHTVAAERYGVEVSDGDVQDRISELLGGDDPAQVYLQLAQEQGVGRQDVFLSVRQQLVRLAIAEQEGLDEPLTEDALRARFEEVRGQFAELDFGFITVPDQPTADEVVAQLEAQPGRYAEIAARFAGDFTLPTVEPRPATDIPAPLAQQAAAAAPGTAFAVPVPETGGIVVGFVAGLVYPEFDELRPQLEQQAGAEVDEATGALIQDVREDVGIEVNPRYGDVQDGRVQSVDGGVVDILSGEG